jgi:hypothetical protein
MNFPASSLQNQPSNTPPFHVSEKRRASLQKNYPVFFKIPEDSYDPYKDTKYINRAIPKTRLVRELCSRREGLWKKQQNPLFPFSTKHAFPKPKSLKSLTILPFFDAPV